MMKKLLAAVCAAALTVTLFAGIAQAGTVYDREVITLGTTTGAGAWTNDYSYTALELKRLWMFTTTGCTTANQQTVTFNRITSGGTYTQSVGSVVLATNGTYTSSASFTAAYLKYGDVLSFSGSIATGGTGMVEFEVQKH